MSAITLKNDRELPKPIDASAKIDDVSVVTLKSDIKLQKPTYVGAKIDFTSLDICTDLLFDFYDFDLGSFDCNCDNSDEFAIVCSICVEISSAIHSDCDAGEVSDPPSSLSFAVNLLLPSTIQPPSLELKLLPEHLKYAKFLKDL